MSRLRRFHGDNCPPIIDEFVQWPVSIGRQVIYGCIHRLNLTVLPAVVTASQSLHLCCWYTNHSEASVVVKEILMCSLFYNIQITLNNWREECNRQYCLSSLIKRLMHLHCQSIPVLRAFSAQRRFLSNSNNQSHSRSWNWWYSISRMFNFFIVKIVHEIHFNYQLITRAICSVRNASSSSSDPALGTSCMSPPFPLLRKRHRRLRSAHLCLHVSGLSGIRRWTSHCQVLCFSGQSGL